MGDTVECVRPSCDEVFDPDGTGGSCPTCQTPHPDATTSSTRSERDTSETESDVESETTEESKPEVPCPDPDCSGTVERGEDSCSTCSTERSAEFDDEDTVSLTCPNGHEADPEDQFCSQCGEPIPDDIETDEDDGPTTCPNGHEVDPDAKFCPQCGEQVSATDSTRSAEGPSVTLEIGSQSYEVIENGEITVDDDEKSADVFGTDARRAAQAAGVAASTARQIHRDYLQFRVEGEECFVTNLGRNPTKYNDDVFQQNEERQLADGDTIELGAGAVTAVVRKEV